MSEDRKREVGRFMLSGFISTAVDYTLLNLFVIAVGVPVLVANSISAPFSSFVSYKLNKHLVFEDRMHGRRKTLFLYATILAVGILLIQNGVIHLIQNSLALAIATYLHPVIAAVGVTHLSDKTVAINIAKILGSLLAAGWNYVMLRRFVFVTQAEANDN